MGRNRQEVLGGTCRKRVKRIPELLKKEEERSVLEVEEEEKQNF